MPYFDNLSGSDCGTSNEMGGPKFEFNMGFFKLLRSGLIEALAAAIDKVVPLSDLAL